MGTTADKLTYLNNTKLAIKNELNKFGADIEDNDTFRSYVNVLESIYNDYPTINDTGGNILLNNTKNAPFKKLELNSTELTQDETPSPSNPVDVNVITGDNNVKVETKNLLNFTFTNPIEKNGITFTKNNNGSLTLNGTATMTFTQIFNITPKTLKGTYTIKHNVLGGTTSASSYLSIQKSPSGNISDRVYGGTGSSTFDITEDTTIITASLYITSGTTFTDYNVGSQLEIGSTPTEYVEHQEQNYPISLSSKNLLNVPSNLNFKATYSIDMELEAGNYTLSWSSVFTDSTNTRANIIMRYEDGTLSGNNFVDFTSTSRSLNPTKKVNRIYLYSSISGPTSADITITYNNLMLEKGSTATKYEPYIANPIEYCKIGDYADQISNQFESKNLLNIANYNGTINNLNIKSENQQITINATANSGTYTWIVITKDNFFTRNGTPSASAIVNYANGKIISTGIVSKLKEVISGTSTIDFGINLYDENGTAVSTPIETTKIIAVGIYLGNGQTFNNYKFGIQLEEGDTLTEYMPYGIIKGEWYLKKNIGKVTFDGSESWSLSSGEGRYSFWKFNYAINNIADRAHTKYCNRFIYSNQSFSTAPIPSLCENSGRAMFIFNTDGSQGTTTTAWQSWLSSNNVIVYCLLEIPQYIHISQADYPTLKTQLDNLYNNANSYDGQTNITQTNDGLPFNINASALMKGDI